MSSDDLINIASQAHIHIVLLTPLSNHDGQIRPTRHPEPAGRTKSVLSRRMCTSDVLRNVKQLFR